MDISIILVNYNSSNHTINCINSICEYQKNNKLEIEIIVVDNGSKPEDFFKCKKFIESVSDFSVKLIKNRLNTGFASGNMIGANLAEGKYFYFLNNDCLFQNDVLLTLYNFMEQHTNAACCAPRMVDKNGNKTTSFQYFPSAASKWLGNSILNKINSNKWPSRKHEYKEPIKVPVVSGASMFVNASLFYKTGGFDTNFFLYCEEEDLCVRFKKAGYDVYYCPDCTITHLGGESTNHNELISKEYYISLWYYLSKHCNLFDRVLVKLRFILREFFGSLKNPSRFKIFKFCITSPSLASSMRHLQNYDFGEKAES